MSHNTQKSHKSLRRDKPKHSILHTLKNGGVGAKKSGAGGKGTWGRPGDELNDTTIHKDDPNYDQDEDESSIGYTSYEPAEDSRHRFASSIEDFNKFKDAIKAATMEYLNSADATEFANCVKETRLPVYHQDIPYIVIKSALDRNDEERKKISHLLLHLHKHQLLTPLQVEQGFRKLYNSIDDLLLDAPNARSILRDYVTYAYGAGLLEKRVWDELEETDRLVSDATTLKSVKEKINAWIVEYFRSEDMHDARETLVEMSIRHLHFEAVKRLISCALDRTNRQRELTSQLLAFLVGDVIKPDDVARAFSILLERVEDLYLDVPDVLTYLSCFLARAVSDEVIPPAFLIRVDLTGTDMGAQVVAQAQHLLKQHDATERLQAVWGHTLKWEEQEQEQEEDDINKEKKKTKEEEKTPQK